MRESIRSVTPVFNTHRMVKEYNERLYEPAASAKETLAANSSAKAAELSRWKDKMRKDWPQIRIADVEITNTDRSNVLVGEMVNIRARVHLGHLDPNHVRVQAYYGESENNVIVKPQTVNLDDCKKLLPSWRGSIDR